MRSSRWVVACGLVSLSLLAGCGSSNSSGSNQSAPQPPVANAGGPYSGMVGAAVSFSGVGSSDPQGQTLTYAWNFGDGSTGTGVSPSHTYAQPGTYSVSLMVTDTSGLTGTAPSKATIAAAPPLANVGGPYTGTVGTAVSFSGSGSSDPQGQTLTYAWNFGDGSTGIGVGPSHTYGAPGTYTVSLIVTDTSGLTGTATSKATIAVGPPVANAGGPYTGTVGTAVSFSGSGSSDPQGQTLTYAWNFGDGSTGTGVSPSHTYSTAGTYTVTLSVTNTSGLTGMGSSKATIAVGSSLGVALTGLVYGGQQPIVGAHVYLFAANTTGYGGNGIAASSSNESVSLLNAALTGSSDSIGAYVLTGSNGGFSLTGEYSCSSGEQLYLYALGGNSGSGANAASGLMAAIGSCPASGGPAIFATVNEVTTVAAAYAMAGFATDATHVSSSGTALAQVGTANAFANAGNLATLATGVALATTPAGNGAVPQAEINTLANILAACVNSSGTSSTACSTLLGDALSGGSSGTAPGDTATAAINIAHNPIANLAALYALGSSTPPFAPALSAQPNDFTVVLAFSGGGLDLPGVLAVDGSGDIWTVNGIDNTVVEQSSSGAFISGVSGYTGGGLGFPNNVAIDVSGNAWVTSVRNSSIAEISSGSFPSGASGYTGGSLSGPISLGIDGLSDVAWVGSGAGVSSVSSSGSILTYPVTSGYPAAGAIAVDGSENVWLADAPSSVVKFTHAGALHTYTAGGLSYPGWMAIDSAGSVWIANSGSNSVTKISNSGSALSGTSGFTGGGLGQPSILAVDGSGKVWITNSASNCVIELSNSGVVLSGSSGYLSASPSGFYGIAVDGSGNVWTTASNSSVEEIVGAAAPVVTPLAVGVKNDALGTRP